MKLSELQRSYSECIQIGKGGQKTVYRVKAGSSIFALKIIPNSSDARVKQEIGILTSLQCSNVPHVYESEIVVDDVTGDEMLYMIEEFIDGSSLRSILQAKGCIDIVLGSRILETLLRIECTLEERQIIHRDIKPDNIMITRNATVYLIDFGIAKVVTADSLTLTSQIHGPCTPLYAPRELAENARRQQDVRTDLYQIGVSLYESFAGENPFKPKNITENVWDNITTIIPSPIVIPGDTKGLLMRYLSMLMAKNQSQRPNSAKQALKYFLSIKQTLNLEG